MIILRCVRCESERAFYGRSVNVASGVRCADCGGCSWEMLLDDGPAMLLTAAEIRQAAAHTAHDGNQSNTFAYGSLGEYLEDE